MEKRKGLTLMELIVTIIVGLLIIAIILPPQGKVKKISHRVVCATNLKGLGTAMVV
ncbi:MAG: type II secretion system protein [Planctomycetota bacterium]|jgi:prepilin-type N-terminal cleavage/methylation domain-containing protein